MTPKTTMPLRARMNLRPILTGLAVPLLIQVAEAQLTVAPQTNLQALATTITGPGVIIANPVINCHAQGYGTFTYTGSNLGIDEGVILTSGKISDAIGPNSVENKSFEQGTSGNALLNVVTGRNTRDACLFEFDIIPSGDSLRFNFVLGSEEYNEWVGSQYNDVFGFFISGPGIVGDPGIGNDHNIALVPGTNQAVTINNVNNGSNSAYYFDNAGGQHIQYDGLTRGLYAESAVQPCQTYHLKLVVADASDRKFDSGVFIERIRSNQVTMTSHTVNGTPDMVEGCNPGWVTFTRASAQPTALQLTYYLQGSAINGMDYSAIGNVNPGVAKTVTIPANQTSVNVPVNPLADGLNESTENLLFILGNPLCPALNLDTLSFNILDTLNATLSPNVARICRGDSLQLQVNGGTHYAWSPAYSLSSSSVAAPWAKPVQTTTYTVVVNEGTCSRTMSRQVRVSNMELIPTITAPLCSGATNGAINLQVQGGIAPYTYSWTGPNGFTAATEDLVNIAAGTYTLVITDDLGCTRTRSFNVGSPAELTGTLTPSIQPFGENIACHGATTGTLNLALVGGTAPYAIAWTGPNGFGSNNQNLTGIGAGNYSVQVNDANGCTFSASFNMTEPTVIAPVMGGLVHVQCYGSNTGEATVQVSGGLLPYSYTWNSTPVQNTATATGLAPGSYTVTITDGYNCSATATATIIGPTAALNTTVQSTSHVTCFGGNNGAATISATGGTAPYTYLWNTMPAQHAATATNLTAGTWTCTVTDANGCSTVQQVSITQPAASLAGSLSSQTNVACFGGTSGSASIAASGGTAPYSFVWNTSPAQHGATANNLPAGTWICSITDANGCATTLSVDITQPAAALATSIADSTPVGCFGDATGSASITATGGTAPYSYSWNTIPVQNSATAVGLTAGTWACTVTDANGCTAVRSVSITQPSERVMASAGTVQNVNCHGDATGSANIVASGGTAPYSYSWNTAPVQTSSTASDLVAGTWTCIVTDANGCTATRTITITQPAAALSSILGSVSNVACNAGATGSATVIVSGGTGPYSYSWNTSPTQNTATANGLIAGTWTCTITDARQCSTSRTVTITEPATALSVSLTHLTNVSCYGANTGSATVEASGGTAPYTYAWNTTPQQNGATANDLGAGTWTCTVTDARGCSTSQSVTITQPNASLNTTISTQANVACFGGNTGTATIAANGGTSPYTYSWNTLPAQHTATATSLPAGSWSCTVTDANGCATVHSVTITGPSAALSTSVDTQANVNCYGGNTGSASISANGGTAPYSYAWNTVPAQNSAVAISLPAGTWTCTVTDANGCTAAQNVTITQPASALTSTTSAQTNVNCSGGNTGAATLAVSGGTSPYSYTWNTSPVQTTSTASSLGAGTWTCTINDARGCSISHQVTITQPAAPLSTGISAQTNPGCHGGNNGGATVDVSGGTAPYTYTWNTSPVQNSASATNLTAGTWTCTVVDARSCTTTQNVTITQPAAALSTSIASQTPVNCHGGNTGTASINVTGGTAPYSYAWNTSPAQTGPMASGLTAGTWTCTVTDANGCSTARSVTITQPAAALAASLSAQTDVFCFGANNGSATVSITGGTAPYTYAWNTAPTQSTATANNLAAGTWTCTITDARGCTTSQAVTITQPAAALAASIVAQSNVDCFNNNTGSATISASGGTMPYSYVWNTAPTQNTAVANTLGAGPWTCTVTDANGCSAMATATVTQPAAALAITGTVASAICGGAANGSVDADINGGTAPYAVTWAGPNGFISNNTDIGGLGSGVYTLTVSDAHGCQANASFNVGQPGLFNISATTSDFNGFAVSCPTATDGSIAQTITGGTGPYTHAWTGPNGFTANTEDLSTLAIGTYVYTLTDANGCSTSANYTLGAPEALSASLVAATTNGGWNIGCHGASTGSINATITGGVAPVDPLWNGPGGFVAATTNINALQAGAYTLTLTDANGCTHQAPIVLSEAPALVGTASMTSSVDCHGGDDGSAFATASGGTAPYTYSWNTAPVQTDPSATGLPAGTWTCTISDANGCSIQRNATIDQPLASLAVSITEQTDVLCHGALSGSATALASGGTAPYDHVWNSTPAQFNTNATDLAAGTYTVVVTDANGCSASANVDIEQPATPISTYFDPVQHETCFGSNDGAATINVNGGSGSYSIIWDTQPPVHGATATGLAPGLYMVTVLDANGCAHGKQFPVTIQGATAPLTLGIAVDQVDCHGAANGAIDLSVTGGNAPYSHIWTAPGGQQTGLEDIDALPPGAYALHVVDFYGCVIDTLITITEPQPLTTSGTVTTAACQGSATGAVDATVAGGTSPYTFAWSGPNGYTAVTEDINALAAGIYTLNVTDAQGCTRVTDFNVNQPGSVLVNATTSSFIGNWGVSCANASDGSIDLEVTGGTAPFSYTWSGPNGYSANTEDISGLISGNYSVSVSDANGCTVNLSRTITAPNPLSATLDASTYNGHNISCAGLSDGSLNATVSGGTAPFSFSWTGPNGFVAITEDISGLAPGSYGFTVTDANGCSHTGGSLLTEPAPLIATTVIPASNSGHAIACNGTTGRIDLEITGGNQPWSITWSGPDAFTANTANISDLVAGTYTATINDANGCTTQVQATLSQPDPLVVVGLVGDHNGAATSCADASDGSIDLSVTGGAGGHTFIWSSNNGFGATTEDVTGLEPGNYHVLVTDMNGCTSSATFLLEAPEVLSTSLSIQDHHGHGVSCNDAADGRIDLAVSGGTPTYSITWAGPNGYVATGNTIQGLQPGNYTATIADANGCTTTASTTLTAPSPLDLAISTTTYPGGVSISCAGSTDGAIDLTITGGTAPYTVSWSDGVGFSATTEDITGLSAGLYQAMVTDANGCSAQANELLTAPAPLDLVAVLSNINGSNVTCNGATDGSIDLTVSGGTAPYSILWNDGTTTEDRAGITAGTYTVEVSDANGCAEQATYTLLPPASVLVDVTANIGPSGANIICAGGNDASMDATINGGTLPYTIAWNGPDGFIANTANISSLYAGTYTLNVTDANGCAHASTHQITEPAPVHVDLASVTYNGGYNIPCATIAIGVFNATTTGGTPAYTYAWTGPNGFTSTNEDLVSLEAGQYDLLVTDANGCTGTASATLTAPDPLEVVIAFTDFDGHQVSCAGNDGGVEVTVSGGSPQYQFDWTGPDGYASQHEDISGLSAGSYTLVVTDANGCRNDSTITLSAPEPINAAFSTNANLCADGTSGTIDLSITGGGLPYSLAWTGPDGFSSTDEDLSALVNGTYTVSISDGLGCAGTFQTTLAGPAPMSTGTYVSFYGEYNLQCQGDSTGVINLQPSGGLAPFTVTINGPGSFYSTTLENTGLIAGDYAISITDANGCVLDSTITLSEPPTRVEADLSLSVYPSGTNVSCFGASDGSIDATISGGNGPYVFSWRGPDEIEFANTEDIDGLPAGDYAYELVVTDANQCSFFTTVTLTQPDSALVAIATATLYHGFGTTCNGISDGAINLAISGGNGGHTVTWTGPDGFSSTSSDITGLAAGTYTATVVDINGCIAEQTVDITAPELVAPTLNTSLFPGGTQISCASAQDGSIEVITSGGVAPYTYAWTGPNGFSSTAGMILGLGEGTFCATITDANGCIAQSCSTLAAPAPLELAATATPSACSANSGSVDLNVIGGSAPFQFTWDNGANTEDISGLSPGAYHVSVVDANGCSAQAMATVTGSPALEVTATSIANLCHGEESGQIDLSVTSGTAPFTFVWNNGETSEDLIGLGAGQYMVSVTDALGCAFSGNYTIEEPTAITMDTLLSSYAAGHHVSAYGAHDGSITTAVSGGAEPYQFSWSNGATTESISGLAAGSYTLLVTDANGCTATLTVELTQPTDLEMPTAFSPNGDNDNERFVIHGIEGNPKNLFTVLNRWGNVVYERPNYSNEWAGENSQGAQLPNGTYFVILSINGGERTLQGYVDLRR